MTFHRKSAAIAVIGFVCCLVGESQPTFAETQSPTSKVVVVFVDLSISAQADRERYKKDLSRIAESLGPGDRLIVAPITAQSLATFEIAVDEELPPLDDGWNGNELLQKRKTVEKKKALQRAVDSFWQTTERSKKTAILDTLAIAQKLLDGEKRRKVLIFLSDMIEDSERYNFDRLDLTKKKIDEIIKEDRAHGILPKLAGVHVYVSGASAPTDARYKGIEAFWTAYFDAAGADCHDRYAHALINFSE